MVVTDPVLYGFLDGEVTVWDVSIPRHVPTCGPWEWVFVTVGCWDSALEKLFLLWTVPLTVHHFVTRVSEGTRVVLAWGVLAEVVGAGRVVVWG